MNTYFNFSINESWWGFFSDRTILEQLLKKFRIQKKFELILAMQLLPDSPQPQLDSHLHIINES